MATWIWRWRRTMLEKEPWIALTASPHFARPAITCRKCRMLISGQAPGASKACGLIRVRFAKIPIPLAARFSPTIEWSSGHLQVASRQARDGSGTSPRQELGRKAGALLGQKFLHKIFARVSPVFLVAGLALLCLFPPGSAAQPKFMAHTPSDGRGSAMPRATEGADRRNSTGRRQAASTQYARAEDLRAQLNSKPADKRALSEYKQAVSSYRRVYLITPHAGELPDALLAVAELYTEMGEKFGRSYYQLAAASYKFLVHEYPTSHYGQDAMLRMARLQKDQLGDTPGASKTFEEFLKKYPRSTRKREAQEALAEIALLRSSDESAEVENEAPRSDAPK